jgi:hypothetical protein
MYRKPRRRMEIAGINEKETGDAWALVKLHDKTKNEHDYDWPIIQIERRAAARRQ